MFKILPVAVGNGVLVALLFYNVSNLVHSVNVEITLAYAVNVCLPILFLFIICDN